MARMTISPTLERLFESFTQEAIALLLSGETGSITLHFDGRYGMRREIIRKGELVQIEVPDLQQKLNGRAQG